MAGAKKTFWSNKVRTIKFKEPLGRRYDNLSQNSLCAVHSSKKLSKINKDKVKTFFAQRTQKRNTIKSFQKQKVYDKVQSETETLIRGYIPFQLK